jgi:hypothetical protein
MNLIVVLDVAYKTQFFECTLGGAYVGEHFYLRSVLQERQYSIKCNVCLPVTAILIYTIELRNS